MKSSKGSWDYYGTMFAVGALPVYGICLFLSVFGLCSSSTARNLGIAFGLVFVAIGYCLKDKEGVK